MADSNSRIAWHRAQLKKNREALKSLEVARFAGSHDRRGDTAKAMAELTAQDRRVREVHRGL